MKDEHIQQKLVELEAAILKETKTEQTGLSAPQRGSNMQSAGGSASDADLPLTRASGKVSEVQRSDMHYFGGIGLVLFGLFMLFQHVRVSSGYGWGFGGFYPGAHIGYMLVPLLVGIGMIVYNSKNVWGWLISAVTVFMLVFTIISGLTLTFTPLSMIDLIIMLLPFSIGGAFVVKGMGGAKGIDEAIKKQIAENKKQ